MADLRPKIKGFPFREKGSLFCVVIIVVLRIMMYPIEKGIAFLALDIDWQFYLEKGYAVFRNCISEDVCDSLVRGAQELTRRFDPTHLPPKEKICRRDFQWDTYYDDRKQRLCLFPEACGTNIDSPMKYQKMAIKKISYALHHEHVLYKKFVLSSQITNILSKLFIQNPVILQSMLLAKHPLAEKGVMCHQDASYLLTYPQSLVGIWVALDSFTSRQGCLYVQPEGHQLPLKYRLQRKKNGLYYTSLHTKPWELNKMIPLEVEKGSVVAMHGLLPHMSLSNQSSKSRHAFSLHVMSGNSRYCGENWLQQTDDYPFVSVKSTKSD